MMFSTMRKVISRSGLIHKMFMPRCSKGHQYEMALYNEKPQISTSLLVSLDKDKRESQSNEVRTIRKSSSRIFSLAGSSYVVFSTYFGGINNPVADEGIYNEDIPVITVVDFFKWFAKSTDLGDKDPVQPGGRIGKLDAANEAGFFYRTDRSRLKEIKKKLRDKPETAPTEPKKTA